MNINNLKKRNKITTRKRDLYITFYYRSNKFKCNVIPIDLKIKIYYIQLRYKMHFKCYLNKL